MKKTCMAALLATASVAFAESPFVGTWKLNRDKTERDRSATQKIESDGKGGIRFLSPRPIYGGPLDGSKRPGLGPWASDTFVLKRLGERSYSATMSRDGKEVFRERVEVSADGKTLTDSFTTLTPRKDGKQPTTVFFSNRIGGDGKPYPFLGVWKGDDKRTKWGEEAPRLIITESAGVLTVTNTSRESKTTIDLQKSEITVTAPNQAKDVSHSVKKIGERSFERTSTRGGVTTKSVYEVSSSGKTLSLRNSFTGEDGQPTSTTTIYERQ